MKLLIVRHGDPDYAIDSLTPAGWEEAALLSDRLCRMDIKAFYCSPLGRARDTSKPTLERLDRKVEICEWLREFAPKVLRPHDDVPNVSWDWLPQDWTADNRFYERDHWFENQRFIDASVKDEADWVALELDNLLARHGYVRKEEYYLVERPSEDTIVFFCHFGVECVLISHLLGISPMVLWHGTCAAPTSVTTLITEERTQGVACFRMNAFGDISHLYAAGREPSVAARFRETCTSTNPSRA